MKKPYVKVEVPEPHIAAVIAAENEVDTLGTDPRVRDAARLLAEARHRLEEWDGAGRPGRFEIKFAEHLG